MFENVWSVKWNKVLDPETSHLLPFFKWPSVSTVFPIKRICQHLPLFYYFKFALKSIIGGPVKVSMPKKIKIKASFLWLLVLLINILCDYYYLSIKSTIVLNCAVLVFIFIYLRLLTGEKNLQSKTCIKQNWSHLFLMWKNLF